jgi:hypothetical protein
MNKALLILALVSTSAFAYYEDPHEEFDMTRNQTNKSYITFRQTSNVQAVCDAESRKRGMNGFGFAIEACSFWGKNVNGIDECTVVTGPTANFHTIGHEIRHCIQGNFHNGKNK